MDLSISHKLIGRDTSMPKLPPRPCNVRALAAELGIGVNLVSNVAKGVTWRVK
jgi:hypothetical protein